MAILSTAEMAQSAQWDLIGRSVGGETTAYIDRVSVRREGKYIKYWVMYKQEWNHKPYDFIQVVEATTQYLAECTKMRTSVIREIHETSGGDTYEITPAARMRDPVPGTLEEHAMETACFISRRANK